MKIQTGDSVVITTGKDKGKQGKVLRVLPHVDRVVVEGANMRVRHIKKTATQAGQRITYEASLHVSNVMIIDPKTKKPSRIGYKVDAKTGKKSRFAKKSGETITKAATTKAAKSTTKADEKPAKSTKAAAKKSDDKAPTKSPFWKRGSTETDADSTDANTGSSGDRKAAPSAHRAQGG